MLHAFLGDKPWFAPKRFGYGAGLPIAWQGWALIVAHVGVITGLSLRLSDRPAMVAIALVCAVLLPLPLYAAKTRGGWKWRNGEDG